MTELGNCGEMRSLVSPMIRSRIAREWIMSMVMGALNRSPVSSNLCALGPG